VIFPYYAKGSQDSGKWHHHNCCLFTVPNIITLLSLAKQYTTCDQLLKFIHDLELNGYNSHDIQKFCFDSSLQMINSDFEFADKKVSDYQGYGYGYHNEEDDDDQDEDEEDGHSFDQDHLDNLNYLDQDDSSDQDDDIVGRNFAGTSIDILVNVLRSETFQHLYIGQFYSAINKEKFWNKFLLPLIKVGKDKNNGNYFDFGLDAIKCILEFSADGHNFILDKISKINDYYSKSCSSFHDIVAYHMTLEQIKPNLFLELPIKQIIDLLWNNLPKTMDSNSHWTEEILPKYLLHIINKIDLSKNTWILRIVSAIVYCREYMHWRTMELADKLFSFMQMANSAEYKIQPFGVNDCKTFGEPIKLVTLDGVKIISSSKFSNYSDVFKTNKTVLLACDSKMVGTFLHGIQNGIHCIDKLDFKSLISHFALSIAIPNKAIPVEAYSAKFISMITLETFQELSDIAVTHKLNNLIIKLSNFYLANHHIMWRHWTHGVDFQKWLSNKSKLSLLSTK
jgi:hypothetical protein